MMKGNTLPYPFEPWTSTNKTLYSSFEEYAEAVHSAYMKNTREFTVDKYLNWIGKYLKPNYTQKALGEWVAAHYDKIRYFRDLSWMSFGIVMDEASERVYVNFPESIREVDEELFPGYDEQTFRSMNIIQKLDWMYQNCEFVPFGIRHECFCGADESVPHLFSHIRRDEELMAKLQPFLSRMQYKPVDRNWYTICHNSRGFYYLKRAEA